jgi:protein-S-isoprenylcysteine O-methyltransferase Ste14
MAPVAMFLVFEAALVALLFGSAGRWDLPWFWALLGVHAVLFFATLMSMDPDLRRERMRPGPGEQDRHLRLLLILTLLAHLVVIGLDARFGWSADIPAAWRAVALAGYAAGFGWSVWAMHVNRFFSRVVRLQTDRGHNVVTAGPYRLVRHPGYVGMSVAVVCESVALGSWWSLLPVVAFAGVVWYRTRLEDRFLHAALPEYPAYAATVRYRLVPGIW